MVHCVHLFQAEVLSECGQPCGFFLLPLDLTLFSVVCGNLVLHFSLFPDVICKYVFCFCPVMSEYFSIHVLFMQLLLLTLNMTVPSRSSFLCVVHPTRYVY